MWKIGNRWAAGSALSYVSRRVEGDGSNLPVCRPCAFLEINEWRRFPRRSPAGNQRCFLCSLRRSLSPVYPLLDTLVRVLLFPAAVQKVFSKAFRRPDRRKHSSPRLAPLGELLPSYGRTHPQKNRSARFRSGTSGPLLSP